MDIEERLINGYLGYSITEDGKVIGKKEKPLLPYKRPDGYSEIMLYRKGDNGRYKRDKWLVHVLVAMHFLPHNIDTLRPPKGIEVNHKNKDRSDNRVENLEFVTSRENKIHAHTYGEDIKKWERCVIQMTLDDEVIGKFTSIKEAESKTGVKLYNISKACRGTIKTAGGYKWKYDDDKTEKIPESWENWAVVKDFDDYRVSKIGEIFSVKRMKLMKPQVKGGYIIVKLLKEGVGYYKRVHILVAEVYIPKPNSVMPLVVNHINGDKRDNCVENLEWMTYKENSQHACDTGLCPRPVGKAVIQCDDHGNTISTFETIKEASEKTGANSTTIAMVCNGKRCRSGGYVWKWG